MPFVPVTPIEQILLLFNSLKNISKSVKTLILFFFNLINNLFVGGIPGDTYAISISLKYSSLKRNCGGICSGLSS